VPLTIGLFHKRISVLELSSCCLALGRCPNDLRVWSLVAFVVRSLCGAAKDRQVTGDELHDLAATERQLIRLAARGLLSEQARSGLESPSRATPADSRTAPQGPGSTPFRATSDVTPRRFLLRSSAIGTGACRRKSRFDVVEAVIVLEQRPESYGGSLAATAAALREIVATRGATRAPSALYNCLPQPRASTERTAQSSRPRDSLARSYRRS